jgi:hypothetical protein
LVFENNANFFAENWQNSQKIVIITSTPVNSTFIFLQARFLLHTRAESVGVGEPDQEGVPAISQRNASRPESGRPDCQRQIPGADPAELDFSEFTHICKIFLQICVISYKLVKNESYHFFIICKSDLAYFTSFLQ